MVLKRYVDVDLIVPSEEGLCVASHGPVLAVAVHCLGHGLNGVCFADGEALNALGVSSLKRAIQSESAVICIVLVILAGRLGVDVGPVYIGKRLFICVLRYSGWIKDLMCGMFGTFRVTTCCSRGMR